MLTLPDKANLKVYFLLLIIINVLGIFILSYIAFFIQSERTCGSFALTNTTDIGSTNSSNVLDNPGDYLLQPFIIDSNRLLAYSFCYDVLVNSSNGLKVRLRDQDNLSLGTDYLIDGLNSRCIDFRAELQDNNFLGLECVNCNVTRKLIPQEELLGTQITQIYNHNGVITSETKATNKYTLHTFKSCKNVLEFFTVAIALLNVFTGLILVIIYGYSKFKRVLSEL